MPVINSIIKPVPVVDGGTASTTASTARDALGVEIGVDVQAYDANLYGYMSVGDTRNLGCTLAANTFTICQADGSALADSAGNRGYVCIGDQTAGLSVVIPVVANVTITDGNASQLAGNTFGITAAANWANDAPFFIYFINYNDVSGYFGISRDPTKTTTPATCYGYTGNRALLQEDLVGLIATANIANIQSKPCVCIGSICMQWTT